MGRLHWKVCGMKYPENIQQVAALKPDYMGFIFFTDSPRYVGKGLDRDLLAGLPSSIQKVGVFVNQGREEIVDLAKWYYLDLIQLHGDETPEDCRQLRDYGLGIIKAFRLDSEFNFDLLQPYTAVVDYFLFDSRGQYYGGNGQAFDWGLLNEYKLDVPFFLSGGIGQDLFEEVARLSMTTLYALDVNSRFEVAPARKDISQLRKFSLAIGTGSEPNKS